jgi:hypothetical protein
MVEGDSDDYGLSRRAYGHVVWGVYGEEGGDETYTFF